MGMANLKFNIETIPGFTEVKKITPSSFDDHRGSLWTSATPNLGRTLLPAGLTFNHDKFARTYANVLRGIHGDQKSYKLVSCLAGKVFQVVVDAREESPTFLHWRSFVLGGECNQMILIPPRFGNAFLALDEDVVYHYKLAYTGEYSDADSQFTIAWDDPRLNIPWPNMSPILSMRDEG